MRLKKPFYSKRYFKQAAGKCQVCNEKNYNLLDVHRIRPGSEGGKYNVHNTVCLCSRCHRLEQSGDIRIVGWRSSTMGKVLWIVDEEGNEQFL